MITRSQLEAVYRENGTTAAAGVHWEPTDALLQAPQTEGGRVRMLR